MPLTNIKDLAYYKTVYGRVKEPEMPNSSSKEEPTSGTQPESLCQIPNAKILSKCVKKCVS